MDDKRKQQIRQNWLRFLARTAKEFSDSYHDTELIRWQQRRADTPAMALVKEQIYREMIQRQDIMLNQLIKKLEEYHLNEQVKNWENLAE